MKEGKEDERFEVVFTVRLPPKTMNRLRQAIFARNLSGVGSGLVDAFVNKLVSLIDEGNTEHTFHVKHDSD